jgi:transposase
MEVLYPRCAGIDVHAESVTACVRVASDCEVSYQHRVVATTTRGLLELADWLTAAG